MTPDLLTAILVIAQDLDLNFHRLEIFAHGFQSAKTAKVSSYKNLSAYDIVWKSACTTYFKAFLKVSNVLVVGPLKHRSRGVLG